MKANTCCYCPGTFELLPVGPECVLICQDCATETPERLSACQPYMDEIFRRRQMMVNVATLLGMDSQPQQARGLSDARADRRDCIGKFVLDNGLDPENPDHENRAMDFDMGISIFAQGSPKPDEQEDTADACAGWQAIHDTTIERCHEQADIGGYPVQMLFDEIERIRGIKLGVLG